MRKILTFLSTFFSMALFSAVLWAQEHAEAAAGAAGGYTGSVLAMSAGLTIAIAAAGGAFGQSRAAAAALEGIGRNPGAANKLQTPMIIALALIESLVIYALVIAFLLQGKI